MLQACMADFALERYLALRNPKIHFNFCSDAHEPRNEQLAAGTRNIGKLRFQRSAVAPVEEIGYALDRISRKAAALLLSGAASEYINELQWVVLFLEFSEIGLPRHLVIFNALDSALAAQLRLRISNPANLEQRFVAAAFDHDDLSYTRGLPHADHARTTRIDIVGTSHLGPGFHVFVQIRDPQ